MPILSFRHVIFKENPVIPVEFVFHERKFQKVLYQFLKFAAKESSMLLPNTWNHPVI